MPKSQVHPLGYKNSASNKFPKNSRLHRIYSTARAGGNPLFAQLGSGIMELTQSTHRWYADYAQGHE